MKCDICGKEKNIFVSYRTLKTVVQYGCIDCVRKMREKEHGSKENN